MTSPTRSRTMAAVKSRGTKPELLVADLLTQAGVHHRQNADELPGSPDFVIPAARLALFVHGCWWHGHSCPRGARVPKTNRPYWLAKVSRNRRRDRRVARQLRAQGYAVWTVWECQLKRRQGRPTRLPPRLLAAIRARLED